MSIFIDMEEEDIREEIEVQKEYKNRLDHTKGVLLALELRYSDHENHRKQLLLDHCEKYNSKQTVQSLSEDIKIQQDNIRDYKVQIKDLQKTIQNIKEWQKYTEDQKNYQEWTDKINNLQCEENENRLKYSSIIMLKEKILEAESIAILNVIESINFHSQIYLDVFFTDSPILVRLVSVQKDCKNY